MARKLIALIDVLGFREIVKRTPADRLMTIYKEIEMIINHETTHANLSSRMINALARGNDHVAPISNLSYRIFSDTVVIYSETTFEGAGLYEADLLCGILVRLHNHLLLKHSWLLRGAIAFGEIHVDGDIMFGRDLIRAYDAEAAQDWAGIVVLDKTEIMYNEGNHFTCDYGIPFKTGKRRGTVLNLFAFNEQPIPFARVHSKLLTIRQRTRNKPARKKLNNTVELFEFLINRDVCFARIDQKTLLEAMKFVYGIEAS